MPFYECVYIARQDVAAAQVEALTQTFSEVIAEGGGKVTKTEYWGLKSMAYRIKKNRKGHYVLMNVDAPPAAVAEMERRMSINEDVLRLLTVRVDALEEGPSAMMLSRASRDREGSGREGGRRDRDDGRPSFGRDRDDRPSFGRDRDGDRPPRPDRGDDRPRVAASNGDAE